MRLLVELMTSEWQVIGPILFVPAFVASAAQSWRALTPPMYAQTGGNAIPGLRADMLKVGENKALTFI